MSCCGGSSARPKRIRALSIHRNYPVNPVNPITRPAFINATPKVKMRNIVPEKCPICGVPMSTINVSGSTVRKCANLHCGFTI